MANKTVFDTRTAAMPKANAVNEAGGRAYELSDEQALAQLAVTGFFADTYYVDAESQVASVQALAERCDPTYVAQVACMSREQGYMKDMPCFLLAHLARRDVRLLGKVFNRIIDNGRMLRTFIQIVRSGKAGRRSLGTAVKRMVQEWLNSQPNNMLFRWSVGGNPSVSDIIALTHPMPGNEEKRAAFGYIRGHDMDLATLPPLMAHYEVFKRSRLGRTMEGLTGWKPEWTTEIPDVEFRLLDPLGLKTADWTEIFRRAKWQFTRMNILTARKHGVLEDEKMVDLLAARLRSRDAVLKARQFPYQLLVTYLRVREEEGVPRKIVDALHDAMEVAVENVPKLEGHVAVCVDTSGSMSSPVTGDRGRLTTRARCVDVAALIASVIMRRADDAVLLPFDTILHAATLEPRDTIMTNARKLAEYGGGGTRCALPLSELNKRGKAVDAVVFISDYQSWYEDCMGFYTTLPSTGTMAEFELLRRRSGGKTKFIGVNLNPSRTSQVKEKADAVFQIAGFSDMVFRVMADFIAGRLTGDHWIGEIKKIDLDALSAGSHGRETTLDNVEA